MYPRNIELTIDNSDEIYIGFLWKHSKPRIGEEFLVHTSKLKYTYKTSCVTEILESTNKKIVFKTDDNNTYIINIC